MALKKPKYIAESFIYLFFEQRHHDVLINVI